MARLRIVLELSEKKKYELELFNTLQRYTNPPAYIKDVLRGILPIPGDIKINDKKQPKYDEDNEDLMDI